MSQIFSFLMQSHPIKDVCMILLVTFCNFALQCTFLNAVSLTVIGESYIKSAVFMKVVKIKLYVAKSSGKNTWLPPWRAQINFSTQTWIHIFSSFFSYHLQNFINSPEQKAVLVLSQCKIHQYMTSLDRLANNCTNIHLIIDQFISR